MRTRKQILEERKQLKIEYGELFDAVSQILYRTDPMGIGIAAGNPNTDEYDPETGTILPRLKICISEDDVIRVVHEEFVRWFNLDIAESPSWLRQTAAKIWQLWQTRRSGLI
jgi:hypothetical protein